MKKPERKLPICRWEDDIKKGPAKIRLQGVDWIGVAQGWDTYPAVVNAAMNLPDSIRCDAFLQLPRKYLPKKEYSS
jgi:hypothetical protein